MTASSSLRAKFDFEDTPAGLPDTSIVLRDIGHGEGFASITNDAESVVATVLRIAKSLGEAIGPNLPQIYYYDSENQLDQLLHDGVLFVGFGRAVIGGGSNG